MFEDLGDIERKIKTAERMLDSYNYDYEHIEPEEFYEYMTGPTPSGDKTKIIDILSSRYLRIHELIEMSELKKRGIEMKRDTVVSYYELVYEVHMTAFDWELKIAEEEGEDQGVSSRIRLVESWLKDENMPPHLEEIC
ncbi:MAG: hypothetical protein ACLFVP_03485 [Candidatus Bathyarchaeia archaeon]